MFRVIWLAGHDGYKEHGGVHQRSGTPRATPRGGPSGTQGAHQGHTRGQGADQGAHQEEY